MGKIAVLGLGESLKLWDYTMNDFELSIGVNDIWSRVKTDVVVCIDPRHRFVGERLRVIETCRPRAFYSQLVTYDVLPNFHKIELAPNYPESSINLSGNKVEKSYCSPFVACQIAYKFYNATEIHLFGVDMVNHPYLNSQLCDKIKRHFTVLARALRENNCKFIVYGDGILRGI